MSRLKVNAALLLAVAATAFALVPAGAANAAGFVSIKNLDGKCIQPPPGNINAGVQLMQEPCSGRPEQLWSIIDLGGGDFQLVNQGTAGCLDAHGPNANGTHVDTWPCSTISNQRWHFINPIPNTVPEIARFNTRCLDVSGGSVDDNALIQIWNCISDDGAQAWTVQAS